MALALSDVVKLLDLRRLPAEIWVGVAAATGFTMLAPDAWAVRLGIESFRTTHGSYIGGAFVVSSAILAAKGLVCAGRVIKSYAACWWWEPRKLRYLSPDQKAVLRRYLAEDTCTLNFELGDGIIQELCHLGLIYRSASMGSLLEGWAFNIKPWLRVYLMKHPEAVAACEGEHPPRQRLPTLLRDNW